MPAYHAVLLLLLRVHYLSYLLQCGSHYASCQSTDVISRCDLTIHLYRPTQNLANYVELESLQSKYEAVVLSETVYVSNDW